MNLKTQIQTAARKTLETVDKGLKWAQDNPVIFERTALVVTTAFVSVSAYRKFAPRNIVNVTVEAPDNSYLNNVVNGYETPTGAPIEILRQISTSPYDIDEAGRVLHLEVSDLDLRDMEQGFLIGMMFNVKDHNGIKNTPLAVMPYERFMEQVPETFPRHTSAEALIRENAGKSHLVSLKGLFDKK